MVPAQSLFVSSRDGNDSGSGSLSDPLRSVGAAVSRAAPGQTIVLRGGTYHEFVTVPAAKSGITIQAYPHEGVWFDGTSPVSTWTRSGSTWVHAGWTTQFDHSESFTAGQSNPHGWAFVGPQNPMAAWPDGVWIDGKPLTQVGSAAQVAAGTFYVDYGSQQLLVGSDPGGHSVRASDISRAFLILAPGVTLQGFGVQHYATALPALGTVHAQAGGTTIRDMIVTENATQAITFSSGAGNLVDHVSATLNGMVGVGGNVADNLTIRNSVLSGNNEQRFNPSPSAAGSKITRSRHLTIVNNDFVDNQANGLWFDQSDVGFTIANNTFSGNAIAMQLELADTGIVANNVFDGGKYGAFIFDTGNVQIYNNSFIHHSVGAVFLSQDQRRQSDPTWYAINGDKRYPPGDPTNPWLLRNVTVANNVFLRAPEGGMFQVYALDRKTNIPVDRMNVTINGNQFTYRDVRAQPTMVGWGGGDSVTVTRYETPAALSAAKNRAWQNLQETAPGAGLVARSAPNVAVPLPSDVAAAIGVPAGTTHIGPF